MNWRLYSWMRFTCGTAGKAGGRACVGVCSQDCGFRRRPRLAGSPTLQGPALNASLPSVHRQAMEGKRPCSQRPCWHAPPTASQPLLCPPPTRYLDVEQRLGGDLVAGDILDVRRQVGLLLLLDGAPAGPEAGVLGKGLELLQQGGVLHPSFSAQRLLSVTSKGGRELGVARGNMWRGPTQRIQPPPQEPNLCGNIY